MNAAPSRWKIALALLLIFVGGVAVGAFGMLAAARHRVQQRTNASRWAEVSLKKIDESLHLTPAQRAQIDPLLARMAENLRRIRAESWLGWRRELDATLAAMMPFLDPQQRAALEQMRREAGERLLQVADGMK